MRRSLRGRGFMRFYAVLLPALKNLQSGSF
jgi:hypothetical protein